MRFAAISPLILFLIGLLLHQNRLSRQTAELAGLWVLLIALRPIGRRVSGRCVTR